jgi:Xaa-Pro aminopeptidase
LGKYFTHGIGHYIGLDTTDPNVSDVLSPGAVITVEPGIYIPEERIGIRIEDVVLVTETGHRVLSSALPKDPNEIEKLIGR